MGGGKTLTAAEVAELVEGELVGDGDLVVEGIASLEKAGRHQLAFLASTRYLPYFQRTGAGAALVTPEFRDVAAGPATRIIVGDPARAASRVMDVLRPQQQPQWGVHHSARIDPGVTWEGRLAVGPGAVLGRNVTLGRDCVIGPHAVIEEEAMLGSECRIGSHSRVERGVILGDRVVIKPGARVGGEGFGFSPGTGGPERLRHAGGCIIGDDVEIGANSTVDRGRLEDTVIGAGTKIDNLVQVAHNVQVGERCIIMAQVGIAGSVVVESDSVLAGQAGLADHVRVGRAARVAAQSGVIGDIPAGATVSGYPARHHRSVLRQAAALSRLAPLVGELERLASTNDEQ